VGDWNAAAAAIAAAMGSVFWDGGGLSAGGLGNGAGSSDFGPVAEAAAAAAMAAAPEGKDMGTSGTHTNTHTYTHTHVHT
jgi:hypothetical protein